jgi:hypothetical protein
MWGQGFRFILGYVGPGFGKLLTQTQVDQYHQLGYSIGFLVEGAAGDILDGPAVGADYAHQALAGASALGAPVDNCVFCLAADIDIINSNLPAAVDTYRGFNGVLGLARSGVYGDTDIINALHNEQLASWFFLTEARAWDGLPPQPYIDVSQIQTVNGCAGNYDLDTANTMPRGLWAPPNAQTGEEMMRFVFHGFANTPDGLDGRVHCTNGAVYYVQGLAANVDTLKSTAGAGPITSVTPAQVYNWDYPTAVHALCGVEVSTLQSGGTAASLNITLTGQGVPA